jgi:signal transduction histidine kinase
MVTGYLSLICIAVGIIYAVLDLSHGIYYALSGYILLVTMPVLSLYLIRKRKFRAAKIILILSTNLVIFWSALHDPFETGVFLFFLPTGIGSFAILSFEDLKTGMALAALTTILFLIAYLTDLRPIDVSKPSDTYIQISFMLNYFISLTISILIVYFLMSLNRLSESELILKEKHANEKNMELEKVNEELDRFVYSVSHDLRSPLSSILGLINIARLSHSREELDNILNMMQGRVQAQDHFISEIIDYSRNARTEVHTEPIALRNLVEDIAASLKFNDHANRIDFRILIPEDHILFSDPVRVKVIFSNLIGNAIKYHDLRKPDPFIAVGVRTDDACYFVQDNGVGIAREHQQKIFNMFYRGSDRSGGSGLGLFITREAVTRLGGSINVHSTPGEGSSFTICLPDHKTNIA